MSSVCFKLGNFTAHWYGVMMALGFLSGLHSLRLLGRARGWDSTFCSDLVFRVMVAGIIGARLAYVLTNPLEYISDPVSILRIDQGGLVFYGGLVGVATVLVFFARSRSVDLVALLDFLVTAVPLAHAFGRVGCFINGCCFGAVCDGVLGYRYEYNSQPWIAQVYGAGLPMTAQESLPVYPVQLYEAGLNLLLYVGLVWYYRRRPVTGSVLCAYLLVYPVGRFLLEFLRGDERGGWLGLSQAQLFSMVLLGAGLAMLIRLIGGRGFGTGVTGGARTGSGGSGAA